MKTDRPWLSAVFVALGLAATISWLYRDVLSLWWTYDDAWLLHRACARPLSAALALGNAEHRLFTPLLDWSYEALLAAFGFNPSPWYWFQLVLLWTTALACFTTLRLYLEALPAGVGAFLLIASAPACTFASQLMVMHYLEAILFGALSVIAFVYGLRRDSLPLIALSAGLYFCAALAKEVAVPLPALLLLLPELQVKTRFSRLSFHFVAATVYFGSRWLAIGTLGGGGGWSIRAIEIPGVLAALPGKIATAWSGSHGFLGLAIFVIGATAGAPLLKQRRARVLSLAALFLALAPILIVSKEMQARFTFVPWLWVCCFFAFGVAQWRLPLRFLLIIAMASTTVLANRREYREILPMAQRMSIEARAFVELGQDDVLRSPAIPPAALLETDWMKREVFHRSGATGFFYDDIYLCETNLDGRRFFEFQSSSRALMEITRQIPDLKQEFCANLRADAPLSVALRREHGSLFWQLGPYDQGRWRFVTSSEASRVQAFDVLALDGFRLTGQEQLQLRVAYRSPEGWLTYSPILVWELADLPEFSWQR